MGIHRTTVMRWMTVLVGMLLLSVGCLGSVLLLYGGGTWQSAARLEANSLSALEVSELVGTTAYQAGETDSPHTLLSALTQTLRVPLAQPLSMLESELPVTDSSTAPTGASQTSLFRSLTTWEQSTNKVALGWVPYDTATHTIHMIQQNPGITVISPLWLTVANQNGTVTSRVEPDVVNYAHNHKIKVWALIDNQFQSSLTHSVLSDATHRHQLEAQIVKTVRTGHLDGINVDFENVRSDDQDVFTAFVAELHRELKPMGVSLSVDVTPDIVFLKDNAAFFHAGLAAYCDYVMLMAYDEHWGGDQTPGPVADLPWVTNAVDDLLSTGVAADQLILGMPFYARFWHVHSDGSVTSQAVAASQIDNVLNTHHATSTWNQALGVAYAKYPKPDGYTEVWYETDATVGQKLAMVNNRGLAGVAIWSLGLSDERTWSTMIQSLRQSVS